MNLEAQIRAMADVRRRCVEGLRFLDAGIWLGAPVGFPLATELLPEELVSLPQRSFIAGGLVSHWRGKTASAQDGNSALEAAAAHLPTDMYTVWTGLPLYPAEPGPLPGQGALPPKVRGVRIFPKSHNYPLIDWTVGSLCRWLVEHRLPLLIWHVELDWLALDALAETYPDLNVIVETQPQKILYHSRPLFALMQRRQNILVEISNLIGPRMVEYGVKQFGAERLLFGTFQPISDPLVPIGMVIDAEITESEKALMAGGNLRRLIDEVRP